MDSALGLYEFSFVQLVRSPSYIAELAALVASAADVSFKPWLHAAVVLEEESTFEISDSDSSLPLFDKQSFDLTLRVECRNSEWQRFL